MGSPVGKNGPPLSLTERLALRLQSVSLILLTRDDLHRAGDLIDRLARCCGAHGYFVRFFKLRVSHRHICSLLCLHRFRD